MEQVQELVYILSLNKTKKIRQYGFLQDETGRLLEFYKGLVEEKFNTDEEAANILLGVNPKHKTYRRLKNKLKEELLNAFLFLDVEKGNYTDLQQAYYSSYKKWAQVAIIRAQSVRNTSINIAEQLLKKAIEYDFTVLILDLASQLRKNNAVFNGNEKKHLYYSSLIKKHLNILQLETIAEETYTSIIRHYAKSKATQTKLFDIYQNDYKEIYPNLGKTDSYLFNINGYLVGVTLYMSINDFRTTAQICKEAIHYFENKSYNHVTGKLAFLYQLVICSMQLGKFDEGKKAIEKCYILSEKGKHHWFRTLENHLLLCLYTQEFKKAFELFQTAKKNKGFNHLLPAVKERWQLHEAYVQFLVEIGKTGKDNKRDKKFRIQRFLNDVPSFTQDKRGLNIPILILQVLFLWNRNKFDDAYQRIEALSKYNSRYLKKGEDTYRTSCFIKMLEVAAKFGFEPQQTEKNAQKYFDKMMEQEIVFANQSAEIEYIPYDQLWHFALDLLKNNYK